MIVCPNCGKELPDGNKFCSKCGTSLANVKAAEDAKAAEEKAKAEAEAAAKAAEEKAKAEAEAAAKAAEEKAKAEAEAAAKAAEEKAKAEAEAAKAAEEKAKAEAEAAAKAAEEKAKAEAAAAKAAEEKAKAEAAAAKAAEEKAAEAKAKWEAEAAEAAKAAEEKAKAEAEAAKAAEEKAKAEAAAKAEELNATKALTAKAEETKTEAVAAEAPKAEETKAEDKEKKGFSLSSSLIKFICIGVAAVFILIIAICLLAGGKKGNVKSRAVYAKENEIMYNSALKEKKSWQVTEKLIRDGGRGSVSGIGRTYGCALSKDGKYLIYPDKTSTSNSLYIRDLTKPKKEGVKIDSEIEGVYYFNDSATLITYKKNDSVWQFDVKKGEKKQDKVAKDVSSFRVTDDGSKILYVQNKDGQDDLHLWTKKADKKLASDIDYLAHASDDFKTVYYVKNNKLMKKVGDKDEEKIASDIRNVYAIYDSGEAYYTKVDDDNMATLVYFNGKSEVKLEEDFRYGNLRAYADDESKVAILVYGILEDGDNGNYSAPNYENKIAVKGNKKEIEPASVEGAVFDPNGKFVYFVGDVNRSSGEGTLYKAIIASSKVSKVETYEEDVFVGDYVSSFISLNDGKISYFKDVSNYEGDLYQEKKKLDSEVYVSTCTYDKDSKTYFYYSDYDNQEGTLKMNKGGKATKIADEVRDYASFADGTVIYLKEYDKNHYEGTLFKFSGKKSVRIDDEVSALIHFGIGWGYSY